MKLDGEINVMVPGAGCKEVSEKISNIPALEIVHALISMRFARIFTIIMKYFFSLLEKSRMIYS